MGIPRAGEVRYLPHVSSTLDVVVRLKEVKV